MDKDFIRRVWRDEASSYKGRFCIMRKGMNCRYLMFPHSFFYLFFTRCESCAELCHVPLSSSAVLKEV